MLSTAGAATDARLDSAPDNKKIKPFPAGNEVLSPLLTMVNTRGARGEHARRIHEGGVPADARQRLLDGLEAADRNLELLADARVRADKTRRVFAGGGGRVA